MGGPPGSDEITYSTYLLSREIISRLVCRDFAFFLVVMRVMGGEVGSAAVLAPRCGPLGLVCTTSPVSTYVYLAVGPPLVAQEDR